MEFLEIFLNVKGMTLPTRVCKACVDKAKKAKALRDKFLRSFDRLKSFSVPSQLIWGRAKKDGNCMKRKFEGVGDDHDFSPSLDYVPELFQL